MTSETPKRIHPSDLHQLPKKVPVLFKGDSNDESHESNIGTAHRVSSIVKRVGLEYDDEAVILLDEFILLVQGKRGRKCFSRSETLAKTA